MSYQLNNIRRPTAFISCSLREEDRSFVAFVAKLADEFGFIPCMTVGLFSAAPRPLWEQMREGVSVTDCLIVAATPRYIEQDVRDRSKSKKSISEMIHVECGMAVAFEKPILVFASEGTDVGNFLPGITQHFELKRDRLEFTKQHPLIQVYFSNAYQMILNRWQKEDQKRTTEGTKTILSIVGMAAILKLLFGNDA